ncbi:hypothetical protein P43SY_000129 [Pythium insidiosum]|uniref:Transmembrane protein n=1 Tax=Pythium insidiosum TaxID=114742 RepID=A0AAD5M2R1_PYTIN|nr:hypothetical protein P43SY_000129 [Pythium insidiosum]
MMSDTVSRRPRHSGDGVRQQTIAPTTEIDIVALSVSPPPSTTSAASGSASAASPGTTAATIAAMAAASSGTVSARRSPLASSSSRKMSTLQLRAFFLVCVSLYLATICFADDIVRAARWVRDADPSRHWRRATSSDVAMAQPDAQRESKPRAHDGEEQEALRLDVDVEDMPPSQQEVPPSTGQPQLLRGAADEARDEGGPGDDLKATESDTTDHETTERVLAEPLESTPSVDAQGPTSDDALTPAVAAPAAEHEPAASSPPPLTETPDSPSDGARHQEHAG